MSFLNLMRNRLKPKAVNDALTNVVQNSPPDFSSSDAGKILSVDNDGELEWRDETGSLPSVETTDEGKVLTVNSSGEWDAEDIPSQLPSVQSTDEGKVLSVNSSGEWVAANPTSSSYNISSVESKTNKQYNGKDVYVKEYTANNFSGSGDITILDSIPSEIGELLSCILYSYDGNVTFALPVVAWLHDGKVKGYSVISTTALSVKAVIEYTKPVVTSKKKTK